jgi:predicted ATP-grasp superfamily ATP-dependent carboligase
MIAGMPQEYLTFLCESGVTCETMLIALTGWMDGGRVSTGTLKGVMEGRRAREFARIDIDPFYILNFPGPMEVAAMLRPEVKYEEGIVDEYELPPDTFYVEPVSRILLFSGREPNLRWRAFADCILEVARRAEVKRIIFMGSFGGTVPHTRQPRMFATVSHEHLKPMLKEHGIRFSNYHGPSSFATMLLWYCAQRDMEMINLVCEIPGYLQGINPPSIEAVTRRLSKILNLPVDLDALRRASDEWEVQITQLVEKDDELAETVRKLEKEYDDELIGN